MTATLIPVIGKDGAPLRLLQPPRTQVETVMLEILHGRNAFPTIADIPPAGSDRMSFDNHALILGAWLPGAWRGAKGDKAPENIGLLLWKRNTVALWILVESYLARVSPQPDVIWTYEQACCDGSTGVPDDQMPMGLWCKDPASMAHDYIFDLHHAQAADVRGHHWTFEQANEAYRDILEAAGMSRMRAGLRFIGLQLFAGTLWNRNTSNHGVT